MCVELRLPLRFASLIGTEMKHVLNAVGAKVGLSCFLWTPMTSGPAPTKNRWYGRVKLIIHEMRG